MRILPANSIGPNQTVYRLAGLYSRHKGLSLLIPAGQGVIENIYQSNKKVIMKTLELH